MDKLGIVLINAVVNFSNLSLLASDDLNKIIAKHCDECDKRIELFSDKHLENFCGIVSKEVLFLESLAEILPSLKYNSILKNELISGAADLINAVKFFLLTHSFDSPLVCNVERHSILSKLTKISSQIRGATA